VIGAVDSYNVYNVKQSQPIKLVSNTLKAVTTNQRRVLGFKTSPKQYVKNNLICDYITTYLHSETHAFASFF